MSGAEQPQSVVPFLRALGELGGSDLHVKVGSPPRVRIDGRLRKLQAPTLTPADTEFMVNECLREDLVDEFDKTNEADFAYFRARFGSLPRQRVPLARFGRHGVPSRQRRGHPAR